MAYTEFCCRSGGSNLNAGTRTGDSTEPGTSAALTYASGSWVASTGVFTVASGDPVADGVAVGDFASVYADGSTVTGFVGRVTARTTTAITVSLIAKSGTAPTNGTNNRTLRIGGAWQGPNGSSAFPLGFLTTSCTNSAGNIPRINFKNDASFSITAGITSNALGPFVVQGYSSTYGDGGQATIAGPTTGSGITTVTISPSTSQLWVDMRVTGTGATGVGDCISVSNQFAYLRRVVAYGARGRGIVISSANAVLEECETYGCNTSNSIGYGGFSTSQPTTFIRCIAHDNAGSNSFGFYLAATSTLVNCIADSNGGVGFDCVNTNASIFLNCDSYNNGSHGYAVNARWGTFANCNAVKNGGFGFNLANMTTGQLSNCGIGSGTQANTSGDYNLSASTDAVLNGVTYAADATPWSDPANGDFRVTLASAKNAGRGEFLQTQSGHSGTVGYPDIGAAQSTSSGGGGGYYNPFRNPVFGG